MPGRRRTRSILYARPGCHLCDQARDVIDAVRRHHPFAFEEVDIEREDALIREYGFRMPVVAVDGREVFEIEVAAGELTSLVAG